MKKAQDVAQCNGFGLNSQDGMIDKQTDRQTDR